MIPNLPRVLSRKMLVYLEKLAPANIFFFLGVPRSHPDTFECVIEPRFGNTVELILQTSAAREI